MQSTIEKPKVVEKIPIGLIWPNPENPRSHINPEAVQKLAANLKVTGQRTPVKFVPLTEGERSANPGCEYKLLGGHLRREAALSLGWETLEALILDMAPEEADLEAILDNRIEELHWLDQYQIIERQVKAYPNMLQSQIAERLGVYQQDISKALLLLRILSPAARELIYISYVRPDGFKLLENPALALLGLSQNPKGDGSTLNGGLSQVHKKVEGVLKVVLERKMTQPQIKALVEWVKEGNQPEGFNPQNAPKAKKQTTANKQTGEAAQTPQIPTSQSEPIGSAPLDDSKNLQIEAIKHKLQSGEKLNMGENLTLVAHAGKKVAQGVRSLGGPQGFSKGVAKFFERVFSLLGKETLGVLKGTVRFVWHSVRDVLKGLGIALGRIFRKIAAVVVSIAVLVPILWLIGDTVFHGNFNSVRAMHGFLAFAGPVLRMLWNMI